MENQSDSRAIWDALVPLEGEQESAEGDAQHPQQYILQPVPRGPLPTTVPPEHKDRIESMIRHKWSLVIELEDTVDQQHRAQQAIDSDYIAIVYPKNEHKPFLNTYTVIGDVMFAMVDNWNATAINGNNINKAMLTGCFPLLEAAQSRVIKDTDRNPIRSTRGKVLYIVDTPGCLLIMTNRELATILGKSERYVKKQRSLWRKSGIAIASGRGWVLFMAGPWRGSQRIMYAYADQHPCKLAPLTVSPNTSEQVMHRAVEDADKRALKQERMRNAAEKRHRREINQKDEVIKKLKRENAEKDELIRNKLNYLELGVAQEVEKNENETRKRKTHGR